MPSVTNRARVKSWRQKFAILPFEDVCISTDHNFFLAWPRDDVINVAQYQLRHVLKSYEEEN